MVNGKSLRILTIQTVKDRRGSARANGCVSAALPRNGCYRRRRNSAIDTGYYCICECKSNEDKFSVTWVDQLAGVLDKHNAKVGLVMT
jgi:hypothetical protein